MTLDIALLLGILLVSVILFSKEWIPADVVALSLLVTLILTGFLTPREAFEGFGSDTVIMIFGLLILTAALMKTGVMDIVGRGILRFTGTHPNRLLLVVMISSAGLGAFMSNTASTAFFIPIVMGIALKAKVSPTRLLMPLAFSSILTSSVTLISTSTNLVVSGLMTKYGMAPMGMFELAPVGIPIAIVGILYMFFIGRRLVPDRSIPGQLIEEFGVRPYLTEVMVLPSSSLVGKTLADSGFGRVLDLTVLRVLRGKRNYFLPGASTEIQADDVLLVEGRHEEILKIKDTSGLEIKADLKLSDPNLQSEDTTLVEVILLQRSPLIGRTLKGFRFRERYGLQVLGLNRHGQNVHRKISQVPLRMGDVLLIQGHKSNIAALSDDQTFRILGAVEEKRPQRRKAIMAVTIFVAALIAATATPKITPLPVAVLIGSILVFLARCITPEEAYREVEWKAIILIASMLGLGVAMDHSGTAKYLAGSLVTFAGQVGPTWLMAGFFILTVLLTQPMSNQAAAVVILPIAVETATKLNLNPRAFAMTVAIAASCSYLTPLEPSCLMVYGPGRYKFGDFLKVGSILTILILVIAVLMIPHYWPLRNQ